MIHTFDKTDYTVAVEVTDNGAALLEGRFGAAVLHPAPLFEMRIKRLDGGNNTVVSSESGWKTVTTDREGNNTVFCFDCPDGIDDIRVLLTVEQTDTYLAWSTEVVNRNPDHSVMEISYPTPRVMSGDSLRFFIPKHAGYDCCVANSHEFSEEHCYPNATVNMQYFAAYGKQGGMYIGFEDPTAAAKFFTYGCKDGCCHLQARFPAIGASLPQNSFSPSGCVKWQFFAGDWYDAAQIYRSFVTTKANWLPDIDEHGRKDIAPRFREVPFWLCDYVPNSESQGNNKPMKLSAGSDIYEKEYWYKAPIAVQKELGVPIAYHVYNWHEIPFNIEYPHFLPAKQEVIDRLKDLHENNIYALPYINAVSWEMNDDEGDHEITFHNTGYRMATQTEDGNCVIDHYPQITRSGKTSHLAPICGCATEWHEMMRSLTRDIEALGWDGVYFDQVSAVQPLPCYNREHDHLPGGGSYRIDGYNRMMASINADKPVGNYYFSECEAEPYMKQFDGFLTWMWVTANEVPAYATVYAGYIQMVGRSTLGDKKEDFPFFKYTLASSLLFGQQLGWCKADVIYSQKHMDALKPLVQTRYRYTDLFNSAYLLRPPVVTTPLPTLSMKPGLNFDGTIVSKQVLSSAWKYRNGKKAVLFAVSIAQEDAPYTLTFNAAEYGIRNSDLPSEFSLDGDTCTVSGTLAPNEINVWEINIE